MNSGTSKEGLPCLLSILVPHNHRNWCIPWRSIGNPSDRKVSEEGEAVILGDKTTRCGVVGFSLLIIISNEAVYLLLLP